LSAKQLTKKKMTIVSILKKAQSISKFYLTLCLLRTVVQAASPLLLLYLPALIIDELSGHAQLDRIIKLVIVAVMLPVVVKLAGDTISSIIVIVSQKVHHGFDLSVNLSIASAPYERLDSPEVYTLVQKIQDGENMVGSLTGIIEGKLFAIIGNAIRIIAYLSILATFLSTDRIPFSPTFLDSPPAALTAIVTNTPVFLLIMTALCTFSIWNRSIMQRKRSSVNKGFSDVSRAYMYYTKVRADYEMGADIRVNGLFALLRQKFDAYNKNESRMHFQIGKYDFLADITTTVALFTQTVILYGFLTCKILYGSIALGGFYLYANAFSQFMDCITDTIRNVSDLQLAMEYYVAYPLLWEMQKSSGDHQCICEPNETVKIEFKNVSFHYPGNDIWILRRLSLTIQPGEHISIVGINGAGKSTLVKLMMGLYTPQEGEILLNGKPIHFMSRTQVYSHFSVVFQDFRLLAAEVGANIAASEKYDEAEMRHVIADVDLDRRLREDGSHAVVSRRITDRGVVFSGGEENKIAIARALYKDAPLIIMDEPAASLDALAEEQINLLMRKLGRSKTTITISHRLSSCRTSDRILVIDGADIKEDGSHNKLMRLNGLYAQMWNAQAKHFQV